MDLIVVDTSALVAILLREPEASVFAAILERSGSCLLSAVSRVEFSMVVEGRAGGAGRVMLERTLLDAGIDIVAVTPAHADIAIAAFRRFGRGRHRAALNLGDCFSYALAKALDVPLLFKGDDFAWTDIRVAV